MPTNFKTYEAQSRLLVAVLASNPDLKLNFKAIALHYGSDATESALEHRFRPLKKQAQAVREAVSKGKDAKDLANSVVKNEKEIAKYYGESTPMGIEFQFRSIKRDAKTLRDAVDKGESPLKVRSAAATPAMGAKRKKNVLAGMANTHGGAGGAHAKRQKTSFVDITGDDEDDDVKYDLDQPDDTPTRPRKKAGAAALPPPIAIPAPAAIAPAAAAAQTAVTPELTMEGTPSEDDGVFTVDPSQATSAFAQSASFGDFESSFKDSNPWTGPGLVDVFGGNSYLTHPASYGDEDDDGAI